MAAIAQRDQENRQIEVDRTKLIETLIANRDKHIRDYEEAKAGYKESLLSRIDDVFAKAEAALGKKYAEAKARVASLTDDEISKQRDSISVVDPVIVEMKVPRCFSKEYDKASTWPNGMSGRLWFSRMQSSLALFWMSGTGRVISTQSR